MFAVEGSWTDVQSTAEGSSPLMESYAENYPPLMIMAYECSIGSTHDNSPTIATSSPSELSLRDT